MMAPPSPAPWGGCGCVTDETVCTASGLCVWAAEGLDDGTAFKREGWDEGDRSGYNLVSLMAGLYELVVE